MLEKQILSITSEQLKVISPMEFENHYYSSNRELGIDGLGKLDLPNGVCSIVGELSMLEHRDFLRIDLMDLYRISTGKKFGHFEIPTKEIIAIMVYGDCLKDTAYKTKPVSGFHFFSNSSEKIEYHPNYANFLVIAEGGDFHVHAYEQQHSKAHMRNSKELSHDVVSDGGIHLSCYGDIEIFDKLKNIDDKLAHHLIKSVPLIYDSKKFNEFNSIINPVLEAYRIRLNGHGQPTNRKVYWNVRNGQLNGQVK